MTRIIGYCCEMNSTLTSAKPGLAMVLALVMGGLSVLVVTRFTEVVQRANNQTISRVQDDRAIIRGRELAEIGSAAIKFIGAPPAAWLPIEEYLATSEIPTADRSLIADCAGKVGAVSQTVDGDGNTQWNIGPDANRRIQRSSRFEVNGLQVAPARTRGYILAGTMVDIENSIAALGINPTMVVGCGLTGNELTSNGTSAVMVSMVTVGGQVVVGDIRER